MQFSDSPISSPQMAVLALPSASTIKDPSALSLIAASASDLEPMPGYTALPLEPGTEVSSFDSYDKPFDTNGPKFVSTWPLHQADQADNAKGPTMALMPRAATYPRAIAINPNGPRRGSSVDNAASQGEIRHKVRGRFTDSRREEVQKVRKMGACIRCRMLRKPVSSVLDQSTFEADVWECSGESPCSTCAGIESARLWKLPCTRARIADEVQLYSVGTLWALPQILDAADCLQGFTVPWHFTRSTMPRAKHELKTTLAVSKPLTMSNLMSLSH